MIESTNPERARRVLLTAALVCGLYALALGALSNAAAMSGGVIMGLVCLCFAYIDKFSEFTASATGVVAKMKDVDRVVGQAAATLEQVQRMAALMAKLQISMLVRHSRLGSFGPEEQDKICQQILDLLENLKVPDSLQKECLFDVKSYTKHDYAGLLLGSYYIPEHVDPGVLEAWEALRKQGGNADPDAIASFLLANNFLSTEREELLGEFRYYLENGEHRNREIFYAASESKWGKQLKKSAEASG